MTPMDTVHDATGRALQAAAHYTDQAKTMVAPRLEAALASARQHTPQTPALAPEARARAEAARAVLRGDVTVADINRLVRRRENRNRDLIIAGSVAFAVALAAGAWIFWSRRAARPEWITDEPEEDVVITSANGSRIDATELTDETPTGNRQSDADQN